MTKVVNEVRVQMSQVDVNSLTSYQDLARCIYRKIGPKVGTLASPVARMALRSSW